MLHRNYSRRAGKKNGWITSRVRGRMIAAAAAATLLVGARAHATDYAWDNDGTGVPAGGSGPWETSLARWTNNNGSSYVAWPNGTTETAVFGGNAGTVLLLAPVNANGMRFDVNGYTIDNGGVLANSLTLAGAAPTITVGAAGDTANIMTNLAGSNGFTKAGAGTLTINTSNVLSGAVIVNAGTLKSGLAATGGPDNTPFGTGSLTLNTATLLIAPGGSGAAVSLAGANQATGSQWTYSGGNNTVILNRGSNSSAVYTIGNAAPTVPVVVRSGQATLTIAPSGGTGANLGLLEKFVVNGSGTNLPTVTNGMVSPSIIGQNNDANKMGTFLTYGANGFVAATYNVGFTNTSATEIADITTTGATGNESAMALRVGAVTLTTGTNVTINLGNNVQAGLILNGGTIQQGTIAFGAAEAVIYTGAAGGTLGTAGGTNAPNLTFSATGKLTTFGPGTLTLGGDITGGTTGQTLLTINGPGLTDLRHSAKSFLGDIQVNGGQVGYSDFNRFGNTNTAHVVRFNGGSIVESAGNILIPPLTTFQALVPFNWDTLGNTTTLGTDGQLFGAAGLTKLGTGTLIFSGNMSGGSNGGYSGPITVSNGTLQVNSATGSSTGSGPVTVAAGTLAGIGHIGGAVTVNTGAHVVPHIVATNTTTLTIDNNLTLNAGSILDFNFAAAGSPGASDSVAVKGTTGSNGVLTLNGSSTLNINALAGFAAGTYRLFSNLSAAPSGGGSLAAGTYNGPNGLSFNFASSATAVDLVVNPFKVWTGVVNSNWDTATMNWSSGAPALYIDNLDGVTFDDTAPVSARNITVTSALSPFGLLFNHQAGTTGYTIGGASLSLPGIGQSIVQTGSGDVTVNSSVVLNGATVNISGTGAGSITLGGGIGQTGGARNLVVNMSGKLILPVAGTYTGATTVNGGTVNIQNNTALGTGTNTVTVAAGASLELQHATGLNVMGRPLSLSGAGVGGLGALHSISGTNTWTGTITLAGASTIDVDAGSLALTTIGGANALTLTGAGDGSISGVVSTASVVKNGTGTWTLSNTANTYGGATTINGGTYRITGAVTGAGAVTVNANATLAGSGSLAGATTVAAGGHLSAHTNPTNTATFNIKNNLTLAAGSVLDFNFAASGTAGTGDSVLLNGTNSVLAMTAPVALNINGVGAFGGAGTYKMFGNFGTASTTSGLVITGLSGNAPLTNIYSVQSTATEVDLIVQTTKLWTGAVNNTWDIGTTQNWGSNGAAATFANGDNVAFGDATAVRSITLAAGVTPGSMTFGHAGGADYMIGTNGGPTITLNGGGALNQNGSAGITVAAPLNVSGNITLGGPGTGLVTLSGGLAIAGTNAVTIAHAAKAPFTETGATTLNQNLTISGPGTGMITLGNIVEAGGTRTLTVNTAGTVVINGASGYTGTTSVKATGQIPGLTTASVLSIRGPAGTLGNGFLDLSNTVANTATILEIGADLAPSDASSDFNRSLGTTGAAVNMAGNGNGSGIGFAAFGAPRTVNIGGAGAVIQYNTAAATMPKGAGDFLAFGSATSDNQIILVNPVDLNSQASERRIRTFHGTSLVPEVNFTGVVSNSNQGSGRLTLDGTGGMIFSNPGNTLHFAMGIFVVSGNVYIGANDGSAATGALGAATNVLNITDANTGTNFAGFLTWGSGAGITPTPSITGARNIAVGNNGTGPITLGGATADTTAFTGSIALGRTVNLNAVAGGRFEYNPAASKVMSGAGGITKTGAGLVVLNPQPSAYTYTGATAVNAGTLQINAAITGAGAVSVNTSGILGGTGSVAGAATINTGGAVSPGTGGAGTFAFAALTLNAGSLLNFDLAAPAGTSDLLTSTALTLNGSTLNITDIGGLAVGTYTLINYSGAFTGAASNILLGTTPAGFNYSLANNTNTTAIELTVAAQSVSSSAWNFNGSGNYGDPSKWSAGVPNTPAPSPGGGAVATFGAVFTGATANVNMDVAATVGTLNFDNSHSYNITGNNTLTINNASTSPANYAQVNVNASGSNIATHTITAPLVFADNTNVTIGTASTLALNGPTTINSPFTVTVGGGGSLLAGAAITNNGTLTVNVASATLAAVDGTGTLNIGANATVLATHIRQSGGLTLGSGANVIINSNGGNTGTSRIGGLTLPGTPSTPTARLDLLDNDLIIDYTGASPLATIRAQLKAAYGNGSWNGANGITSSLANQNTRTLGFAEASAIFTSFPATFSGQTGIDNTTVLIKFTHYGDANLSGLADFADLGILLNHFNQAGTWSGGDFNFSGTVDFADLGILLNNFNSPPTLGQTIDANQYGLGAAEIAALEQHGFNVVPEPAALGLLAVGATGLLRRRRRK